MDEVGEMMNRTTVAKRDEADDDAPLSMTRVRKFSPFRSASLDEGSPRGTIPSEAIEMQLREAGVVFDMESYKNLSGERRAKRSEEVFDAFACGKSVMRSVALAPSRPIAFRRTSGPNVVSCDLVSEYAPRAKKRSPVDSTPPDVPALPRPPYELERCASFFSNATPQTLKKAVSDRLFASGADFEFNPQKYKWKVLAYDEGDENQTCDVSVRMFAVTSPTVKYAVEFQRRGGCAFTYHRWLAPVVNEMMDRGLVLEQNGTKRVKKMTKPFSPHLSGVADEDVPTLTNRDVSPLIEMAQTQCSNVRGEAMRELAKLARNATNHEHIATRGLLESVTLSFGQASVYPDVSRCAASLVNVLSRTPSTVNGPLAKCDMFSTLQKYLSVRTSRDVEERRTQREAVGALVNIMKEMEKGDSRYVCGTSVIRQTRDGTTCQRVRCECERALKRL